MFCRLDSLPLCPCPFSPLLFLCLSLFCTVCYLLINPPISLFSLILNSLLLSSFRLKAFWSGSVSGQCGGLTPLPHLVPLIREIFFLLLLLIFFPIFSSSSSPFFFVFPLFSLLLSLADRPPLHSISSQVQRGEFSKFFADFFSTFLCILLPRSQSSVIEGGRETKSRVWLFFSVNCVCFIHLIHFILLLSYSYSIFLLFFFLHFSLFFYYFSTSLFFFLHIFSSTFLSRFSSFSYFILSLFSTSIIHHFTYFYYHLIFIFRSLYLHFSFFSFISYIQLLFLSLFLFISCNSHIYFSHLWCVLFLV